MNSHAEKRCGRCREIKQASCFYPQAGRRLSCYCKDCHQAGNKAAWRKRVASNPETERAKARARMADWRSKNRELNRQQDRERKRALYRDSIAFRQKIRAKNVANYSANKEKILADSKHWRRTARGKAISLRLARQRKVRKRNALRPDGEWAVSNLIAIKRKRCFYCGTRLSRGFHIEHMTPLSKGGLHAAANIVLACQKCNLSKGALLPNQFLKGQLVLL